MKEKKVFDVWTVYKLIAVYQGPMTDDEVDRIVSVMSEECLHQEAHHVEVVNSLLQVPEETYVMFYLNSELAKPKRRSAIECLKKNFENVEFKYVTYVSCNIVPSDLCLS